VTLKGKERSFQVTFYSKMHKLYGIKIAFLEVE